VTATEQLPSRARSRPGDRPRPLRRSHWSLRYRPRVVVAGLVTTVAVIAVAGWAMTLGSFDVPLRDVVTTTIGAGDGEFDFVVLTLRWPRTLAAVAVGLALAMSGAIFQGLVRNPLVAPDIIGVTSGASLAAVTLIVVVRTTSAVPLGALIGALGAAGLVYALTWRGGISGNRLVLVGIGVNAVFVALTTLVFVRFPVEDIAPAILWTTGTLYGRTWEHVGWIALGLVVLVPPVLALVPRLRTLQLGDASATALGTRPELTRTSLLVLGAALAAIAVAAAGPVGFVALMVPHAARMLLGALSGGVLLVTGLLGGLLVLVSDVLAQHAFPVSLPVGVVTAAVGAPYFLFLLYRTNRGPT
jgi:iron complex transport system permease protein